MRPHPPFLSSERLLTLLAGLLILKVTAGVVSHYHNYFPPNFASDFLRGREAYFAGAYRAAFTTHILSGPVSLILGLILIGERSRDRTRVPRFHRHLGRLQVACVLLLVTPSGLWMAYRAAAGPVAAAGLAALAIATATSVSLGAWAALKRRFGDHRRWMGRCYLLLCSAVVLRLMGGLATVLGVTAPWFDPLATWMCWLLPLAAFEVRAWTQAGRRSRSFEPERPRARAAPGRRETSVP
jgi:small-conductance mechanosensitive channel